MFGQNKTMTGRRIRWLAVTVVAAVVGLGLTASISTPASANMASAYTGATTTVAWKLAPSIHDLATLRANPGAQQTYFGTGAPACTEDSRSFQVDVYKYDAKHKPLVDALVAGGILYIAPKTPNDSAVFVSAQIVTPPRCKPDQPKPEVTNDKETDKSCADGVRERTKTTTVDWVWNEAKWDWVKGEPVVTYSKWDWVRDLTPAEKDKLGCDVPGQPADIVQVDTKTRNDCKVVLKQDKITTTKYVWNKDTWSWVKGEPVVTYGEVTKVRDMTEKERLDQGCIAKTVTTPTPKPHYPVAPTGGELTDLLASPNVIIPSFLVLAFVLFVMWRRGLFVTSLGNQD